MVFGVKPVMVALWVHLPVGPFAVVPVKVFTRLPLVLKRRTSVLPSSVLELEQLSDVENQLRFTLAMVAPGVSPCIAGSNLVP